MALSNWAPLFKTQRRNIFVGDADFESERVSQCDIIKNGIDRRSVLAGGILTILDII
jgi:hypothetical protein